MEAKTIKALFSSQYEGLEKVGPFRKREAEEGNESLELMGALADRWRRRPDSEGKRLVSKVLSLYDKNDPLLKALLSDDPLLFEKCYQERGAQSPRLYWLEIACLCGRERLVNYFIEKCEIDVKKSSNLLAYGLSVGDATFAYRLAHALKDKGYSHPDCLSLYNKCSPTDLAKIKSFFEEKGTDKSVISPKMNI
jgi:hypothetical protein